MENNEQPIRVFGNLQWENDKQERVIFRPVTNGETKSQFRFEYFSEKGTSEFQVGVDPYSIKK